MQKLELEKVVVKDTNEEQKHNLDKKIQVDTIKEEKEEEDEEDEVFVYPKREEKVETIPIKREEEEEEDEEVFVYRGMDAVNTPATAHSTATTNNHSEKENSHAEDISIREEKLKAYYELQVNNLTEKVQLSDSKAVRFASMYKSMKERLVKEDKEKQMMLAEIEKLNKDIKNVQDLLTTTESNYQKQVDTMTEFISSLQQNAEDQQRNQSHVSGRRNNNYNQNSR